VSADESVVKANLVQKPPEAWEKPPRRVTLCITELDVGGAEQALVEIATALAAGSWLVNVVSVRDRGPLAERLEAAGITVTALNCHGLSDIRAIFRMSRVLKDVRPDVLLTFLYQANLVGRIAARLVGVRRVVSGIRVADRRWIVTIPERLTRKLVSQYVAVSQCVADTHCRQCRIPPNKMSVIRNGVDLQRFRDAAPADRSAMGAGKNDFVILFVGRLRPQKAPQDPLEAFHSLPGSLRNHAKLVYIGDGPLQPVLEERVHQLGLTSSVKLLGRRPDVESIMKASSVLVLPSRWEGLPNVLLEAMASGLQIIAADVDGVGEIISQPELGSLYPTGQINRLSELIQQASRETPEQRVSRIEMQRSHLLQFTWPSVTAEYDRLLTDVMAH
jgi:glycosyltransferase involved in cell wall biosynthesis